MTPQYVKREESEESEILKRRVAFIGGIYGAIGTVWGAVLGWGITLLGSNWWSILRGDYEQLFTTMASRNFVGYVIVSVVYLSVPCVIAGVVDGRILYKRVRCGKGRRISAIGTGTLIGVAAASGVILYTPIIWPSHSGVPVEIYLCLGVPALCVGAWHGWLMERWLTRQGARDRLSDSGASGSKQKT